MAERISRHGTGSIRVLAQADGYRVSDMRCWIGPKDPVRENAFPAFRVAAIVSGTFGIRSSLGDAVPVAGSLLLGNACDGYCCRHESAAGDRCINFDFQPDFLERVRVELGAQGIGERFKRALIPASRESVSILAAMEAAETCSDPQMLEEAAFEIAAAALSETHATLTLGRKTSWRNEHAAMRAARYIEAHFDQPCTLAELANNAGMSAFHFLRVYRRVTGQTPHRHVLATRLRHAAKRLRTTENRIADIAMAVGFGDLSTFNASFVRYFSVSPRAYRRAFSASGS
jgi:AraC family transcriptional regulator